MANDDDRPGPAPDLALMFATNAVDLRAVKTFVNRESERRAFDAAVESHRAYITSSTFDVQDVIAPRHNAMVLYGVGGVGKTVLTRALENRYVGRPGAESEIWPPLEIDLGSRLVARLDLASEAGLDLEKVLLTIRIAVARIGRPMYAFDLAFGRYWERVHPNEKLDDYLRSSGALARASEALKLPEQINQGLSEIAGALGSSSSLVSVASQLATVIVRGVRRQHGRRHAIEDCRRLSAILAAEPDLDSLSYFPHLLSWDLAQSATRHNRRFHLVIFLDTFEDVSGPEHRQFERLFNRLVWLMPNALFVISTRNRLDWAESTSVGQLDFAGPSPWPGLVAGASAEPTQHLVGYLAEQDSEKFLVNRLKRGDAAAIPADIRRQISADSAGYPLYLDLAVTRYLQLVSSGARPEAADFRGGFPALVSRLLRDLSPDERRLVRVLSLIDSFDMEMAARIADLPSEAAAARLTERAMIDVDYSSPLPYSIHRLLREEVRRSDSGPDAFTAGDWERYAQRAFDELGHRYREAATTHDRPVIISTLNQALRLADEFDLSVDWCTDAMYTLIEDSIWEPALRPLVRDSSTTAAAALARTVAAVVNRQVDGRGPTAQILQEVLASGRLAGDARDLAAYFAAEALREIGRGAESEALIRDIVARDSRMRVSAVKGLVHRLRRLGRFRDALALIQEQPWDGLWMRLRGTLYWSQGLIAEAAVDFAASRDYFTERRRPGDAGTAAACLAFVSGLVGPTGQNRAVVEQGVGTVATSYNTWSRLMAELGAALIDADGGEETDQRLRALATAGDLAGLSSIQGYACFGRCLNAAIAGEDGRLLQRRADLVEVVSGADFAALVEVVDFWLDPPPEDWRTYAGADWVDGVDVVRTRWCDLLASRRASRRS